MAEDDQDATFAAYESVEQARDERAEIEQQMDRKADTLDELRNTVPETPPTTEGYGTAPPDADGDE